MALLDMTPICTSSSPEQCSTIALGVDGHRIWAAWWSSSATKNAAANAEIRYSDDHGATWVLWASIPTTSAAPYLVGNADTENPQRHAGTLFLDSFGNVYYNCITGSDPGVRGLGRVDATTKAVTKCFDYYVTSSQAAPTEFDTLAKTWSWTVALDGTLYVGQYCMNYWNGEGWAYHGLEPKGHYVWKGNATGTSWERKSTFVNLEPAATHVHAIHVDPYRGTLWVQLGDLPWEVYYSNDGLATVTEVSSPNDTMAFTGLTFTSEYVYLGEDLYFGGGHNQCQLWRTPSSTVYSPLVVSHELPTIHDVPIYYARAFGDDEIWITLVNDTYRSVSRSALVRLTKAGSGAWQSETVFQASGNTKETALWPWDISHNMRGIMPHDHPYVYVTFVNADEAVAERGVYRVQRVATLPPGVPSSTFDGTDITTEWTGSGTHQIRRRFDAGAWSDPATATSPYTDDDLPASWDTAEYEVRAVVGGSVSAWVSGGVVLNETISPLTFALYSVPEPLTSDGGSITLAGSGTLRERNRLTSDGGLVHLAGSGVMSANEAPPSEQDIYALSFTLYSVAEALAGTGTLQLDAEGSFTALDVWPLRGVGVLHLAGEGAFVANNPMSGVGEIALSGSGRFGGPQSYLAPLRGRMRAEEASKGRMSVGEGIRGRMRGE